MYNRYRSFLLSSYPNELPRGKTWLSRMAVCGNNAGFIQPPMHILFSPDWDQNVRWSLLARPWKSRGTTPLTAQAQSSSADQGGYHQ
jgi:hypothetical protein